MRLLLPHARNTMASLLPGATRILILALVGSSGACLQPSSAQEVTGTGEQPADQNIPEALSIASTTTNAIELVPASPTSIENCIPFANNTDFGFTGFIYRNVPAFDLVPGQTIAFDLGNQNDVDVRRNIFFAEANIDPGPAIVSGGNIVGSQGVFALEWTQVVSDTQIPLNPRGNFVKGDFELIYTSEAVFSFPGGGLIVGFGGSPPGMFADSGCEAVLVYTDSNDASGNFYARFFLRDHLTSEPLDNLETGGNINADFLGGMVIGPSPVDVFACDGFEPPFDVALSLKSGVNGAIPLKAPLFDGDGFPVTDLVIAAAPVVDVSFTPGGGGVTADITDQLEPLGRANTDNIFRFDPDTQLWVYNLGTKQYDAPGTYMVTMKSGDASSYVIDPTCNGQFERLG